MVWGPSVTTRGHIWCLYWVQWRDPLNCIGCYPRASATSSRESWYAFPAGQRYSWCARTALSSRNPRCFANWTRMGLEEGTNSFSRVCHNHCRIATTGARYLWQSTAGWHSAPLWLFACENTRLLCHRRTTLYTGICVSFGLNLLSYTPTMINYLPHQFSIQSTCPWRCCITEVKSYLGAPCT